MYVCMYVFGNITYHTYAHTYRPTDSYPFSDWLQRSNPFLMLQVPQDLWGLYPAGRPCWPWQLLILGWFGVYHQEMTKKTLSEAIRHPGNFIWNSLILLLRFLKQRTGAIAHPRCCFFSETSSNSKRLKPWIESFQNQTFWIPIDEPNIF